jgi:hypothetical protein
MMALHLALKRLDGSRALAIPGDLRNHVADRLVHVGGVHILPLQGQPLLIGFNILQGEIASRLVHNQCTRGENTEPRRCRRCPAEPRAEIECRCDPEIQINAKPAAEGNE